MTEQEIKWNVITTADWWNWMTGEYIFHDPDFDEPPEGDGTTFGISHLNMEAIIDSGSDDVVGVGDDPSTDGSIDRDYAAHRIATEPGWHQLGIDNSVWIELARAGSGRW